jgi:peptidoglycan/LPS O-acetylase OafA/YrhL
MGLFRVLLALSVLVAHTDSFLGFKLVGGMMAVKAFFIISGFYMAMVLHEKYFKVENSYRTFISNRFLRLYPIYWAVLLLTFIISIGSGLARGRYGVLDVFFEYPNTFNIYSYIYIFLSNLFILGQDMAMFMEANANGGLHFITNFRLSTPGVYRFFLIPPAWTISLELMFYLIAPFLVRCKLPWLILLIGASAVFKYFAVNAGLNYEPWTYRFFPFELMFFNLGIIGYKIYQKLKLVSLPAWLPKVALVTTLFVTIVYAFIPGREVKDALYLTLVFLTVPLIFVATKKNKYDRYIGEYSYPIYIAHFFIVEILLVVLKKLGIPKSLLSEISFVVTVAFCYLLVEFLSKKIEAFREQRIEKKLQVKSTPTNSITA